MISPSKFPLIAGMMLLAAGGATNNLAQAAGPAPAPTVTTVGGGLLVAPTRLVMEARDHAAEFVLRNQSNEDATYRISLVNRRPDASGRMVTVENAKPEDKFADRMIRYSPRQVTVPAGGTQTVRIAVRRPAELEAGEYDTRIFFQAVPVDQPLRADGSDLEGEGVAIQLRAIYGVTVPIVVKHGK